MGVSRLEGPLGAGHGPQLRGLEDVELDEAQLDARQGAAQDDDQRHATGAHAHHRGLAQHRGDDAGIGNANFAAAGDAFAERQAGAVPQGQPEIEIELIGERGGKVLRRRERLRVRNGDVSCPPELGEACVFGPDGRVFSGDGTRNEDWYCYGRELLAVGAATVVDVRDPKHPRNVGFFAAPPNTRAFHLQTHGDLLLTVADDGPGFDYAPQPRRASGLGLVLGLTRQIGGSFSVSSLHSRA